MGIYSFKELVRHPEPLALTLYEQGATPGIGMPYSPEKATKTMLSNIANSEIPEVCGSYLTWLENQPDRLLMNYGLEAGDLHGRTFTPRLLLGEYFRDQLQILIEEARTKGHNVVVHESTLVTDVVATETGVQILTSNPDNKPVFDRVILATGHVFPEKSKATSTYFPSPWSGLIDADIPACRVGILGTSLSGIDAAMAVATQHGRFHGSDDDGLRFDVAAPGLQITLMSWTGILPEVDFYCPLPYEPLLHMTHQALADLTSSTMGLDAAFALLKAELNEADPVYAARIGLKDLTADDFADAYFADRAAHDPFSWAKTNLEEVERNKARKVTVAWRYAILRMHDEIESLVPHLSQPDLDRFNNGLKAVFVDNYAAVPAESIRRVLALREARVLDVLALGKDYDLQRRESETVIKANDVTHVFDVFIDARGQQPLTSKDLPFPSLRQALLDAGQDIPDVDEDYRIVEPPHLAGRVALGAIPYLMHDRPFVQGIAACAEIGAAMARTVRREAISATRKRRRRWATSGGFPNFPEFDAAPVEETAETDSAESRRADLVI